MGKSKGIIVLDMPENCQWCPFIIKDMRLKTGLCAAWENLHDDMRIIPPDYEKPDWCPVQEMPEKKDLKGEKIMEKLMRRSKVGEGLPVKHIHIMHMSPDSEENLTEIFERLTEYEATGLTPEEIIDGKMLTGWISVEEQLPEDGTHVIATVRHRRWISDYKSDIIPECEWVDHPEWYEVTGVYRDGENYIKLDDEMHDITTAVPVEFKKENLGDAIQEVIAWMPIPEPYQAD